MKTIDDLVYGHTQAKKVLKVLIKRSQDRYYKKCLMAESEYPERLNCLLVGPSGTGKTLLMRSLAKIHGFPLLSIDATELMPTGNDTGINRKQLKKLIADKVKECLEKPGYHSSQGVLNQMVIFVDEFDKLGTCFDSSGNWNKHVQANFLTMIENDDELEGVSWVFAGAFSGYYEGKSVSEKTIGFFGTKSTKEKQEISEQDILKHGIIPELLGRIPLIVELDLFELDDYVKITENLVNTKYSKLGSVDVKRIAEKAMSSGQGIRSITRQLEMALIDHEADDVDFLRRLI